MVKRAGISRSIQNAGRNISASRTSMGQGQLQHIPLRKIRIDYEQPRTSLQRLGLTPEEIARHCRGEIDIFADPNPEKREKFETIIDLAGSIEAQGLINQVTVIRDDADTDQPFILETGGRRYLASYYLWQKEIVQLEKAGTVPEDPDEVQFSAIRTIVKVGKSGTVDSRSRQFIENFHREDLSLDEQLAGLTSLKKAYDEQQKQLNAEELQKVLGVSRTHAYRLFQMLGAHDTVQEMILSREVQSFHDFEEVKALDSREAITEKLTARRQSRQNGTQNLAEAMSSNTDTGMQGAAPEKTNQSEGAKAPAARAPKKGAPAKYVNLGNTENPQVVQQIMNKMLGKRNFEKLTAEVDWNDKKAVSALWKQFIKSLEEGSQK